MLHVSRIRVKYYYYFCKKRYSAAIKTRCGSSMGRLKGCGKKLKPGINWLQRFVETNKHTNIILMEVPHRYDLKQE